MKSEVKSALLREARHANFTIDMQSVERRLDEYIQQYFSERPRDIPIIETYLANAVIDIAILTKRASIGAGDAEGAIFAFCLPTEIHRTCRTSGENCLNHFNREFLLKESMVMEGLEKVARVEIRSSFKELLNNEARSRGSK